MQRSIAAVIEDAVLAGEDVGDLKVLRRYERQRKGDNLAMLAGFRRPESPVRLARLGRAAARARACVPSRRRILSNVC